MTIGTVVTIHASQQRALKVLKPFIKEAFAILAFKLALRRIYKSIEFMQKRIKNQLATRESKIEVLENYWDKIYGQLQIKAS